MLPAFPQSLSKSRKPARHSHWRSGKNTLLGARCRSYSVEKLFGGDCCYRQCYRQAEFILFGVGLFYTDDETGLGKR